MRRSTKFSPEVRDRAVRMVAERRGEHESQWAAIVSIAGKIGATPQTLLNWVRQQERDRPGGARLPVEVMNAFVDEHRATRGVEPICRALQIAPSGYRRHVQCRRTPALRTARVRGDEALLPRVRGVWEANLRVYGADKAWRQLQREGEAVPRCTVERLMRREGVRGVIRGKVRRTTFADPKAPCPLDRRSTTGGRAATAA